MPRQGTEPAPAVRALLDALRAALPLSEVDLAKLEGAARSDAHWWSSEFAVDHDPAGLFCESNLFRYRPLRGLTVRVGADASPLHLARVLLATAVAGVPPVVSLHPDVSLEPQPALRLVTGATLLIESTAEVLGRLEPPALGRSAFSAPSLGSPRSNRPCTSIHRPPVLLGRVELLRYLREQAVSRTLHRYGNVVLPFDDRGSPANPVAPVPVNVGGRPCAE